MKYTKDEIRKHNIKRKAAENYDQCVHYLAAGEFLSAYGYLGDTFQSLDQMEPEQRQHYGTLITGHMPTVETLDVLRPAYEHDYQRALKLVEFSPNLIGEEIDLIRGLRDRVFSVYNLFETVFAIPLPPLTELDDAILKNLERYYRNRHVRA